MAEGTPSRAELIALAEQVATQQEAPKRRWPIAVGVAALAALLVGGLAFALTRGGDDAETDGVTSATTAAASGATAGQVDATDAPATTDAGGGTADATTVAEPADTTAVPDTAADTVPATAAPADTVPASTAPVVTTVDASAGGAVVPEGEPVRWAEFSGGIVYLQGVVPDQATADEVRNKAGAVVGPDNVVVEYEIVPGAPRPPSAPLYVRDSVLFGKDSVTINAEAQAVLDLGVALMNQNPQVTIDIAGHTDDDGTDEYNFQLSTQRVQVILDYLVGQGIDPSRLTGAAYGESQPIADNATEEGRRLNRRVEFTINNLLG
ncbi:MAG: OmpA family protein [Acidimicrobiales bacterium]|nr:OmpA family protein [Acidimicrobiales bacterium]